MGKQNQSQAGKDSPVFGCQSSPAPDNALRAPNASVPYQSGKLRHREGRGRVRPSALAPQAGSRLGAPLSEPRPSRLPRPLASGAADATGEECVSGGSRRRRGRRSWTRALRRRRRGVRFLPGGGSPPESPPPVPEKEEPPPAAPETREAAQAPGETQREPRSSKPEPTARGPDAALGR